MLRIPTPERPAWKTKAKEYGFNFYEMYGQKYWDESAYYQFNLRQVEDDIEDPTAEIDQMCLAVVDEVVRSEELMRKFCIPEQYWNAIAASWKRKDASLYSRIDLVYDGKNPAKLLENNADTPTSLYESGFWQWLWLEDKVDSGVISRRADQFNSLQDAFIKRFYELGQQNPNKILYFASCRDTEEDFSTVEYMKDCAVEAGLTCKFVYVEDIGIGENGMFTDTNDWCIEWLFKLYPWEFMFDEEFGQYVETSGCDFLEPLWKSVVSNKCLLPMLWKLFPNHPNLLPAFFEDELANSGLTNYVKKPIFSREGANVSLFRNGHLDYEAPGAYGEEGYIYQQLVEMPKFGDSYTLIGSWAVNGQPAGMSIREDHSVVTQDMSRFLPHIIL